MDLDSRFNFDDTDDIVPVYENTEEEDLLGLLNSIPRDIGFFIACLEAVENEVYAREIFVDSIITLQERNDDWLGEKRNDIKLQLSSLKKQEDALRELRDDIDEELMRRFDERGTSGTRTSRFTISVREDDSYPEIEDRTLFEDYVISTKKIHLLQKRLSLSAIQEELAAMQEEYVTYRDRLAKSINKETTAESIYKELFGGDDNELLDNKINILKYTNNLVSTLEEDLKDYFSVPGIRVVTKKSINSVKRG
jgi:hypothetical protein